MADVSSYFYNDAQHQPHHLYLDPVVLEILSELNWPPGNRKVFELGCGNGSFANVLGGHGYEVTAIDVSVAGILIAKSHFPGISFHCGSAYDDLAARFGKFKAVVSLEVVEHLFEPRKYAKTLYELLCDDGVAIISTPYHSYLKNLALAISGKLDSHFTALWDYGHIKFWSMKTLSMLLREAGFREIRFRRIGRIPPLAKSMIAVARPGRR
jgi:2-polyprenyl-3-methyl-5-hydroxy-6-metoxy-1,4-benzoquinol methylase